VRDEGLFPRFGLDLGSTLGGTFSMRQPEGAVGRVSREVSLSEDLYFFYKFSETLESNFPLR